MKIAIVFILLSHMLDLSRGGPTRNQDTLLDYLEHHDLAGAGNTSSCFAAYMPELERAGQSWSVAFSACDQQARTVRDKMYVQADAQRQTMDQAALRISRGIDVCLNQSNLLEYFDCFAKFCREQLIPMYNISFNASQNALSLNQKLFGINEERNMCTNRTEHSYVLRTAGIFDELDNCLQQVAKEKNAKSTD